MKNLKIIGLFSLLILLIGCGASNTSKYASHEVVETEMPAESAIVEDGKYEESSNTNLIVNPEDRKIIVSYYLDFDTENLDQGIQEINSLVKSTKGYSSSMNVSSTGNRRLDITLHIPKDQVDTFINSLTNSENLNLLNKSMSSEDMTSHYLDTDLRLKSLREKLDRLNELKTLESSLDQILALENEITNTIFEIESLEGDLNSIDSRIDYTQISISISEIGLGGAEPTRLSFGERLEDAFGDSFKSFSNSLQDFIILLVYLLPYIFLLLVFMGIVKFVISKVPRKFGRKERFFNKDKDEKLEK